MEIVRLPKMGMTMETGEVSAWLKKPGEQVAAGEPLVTVVTDKVDLDVEAPVSGVLAKVLIEEGATAAVGAPIAVLAAEGEELPDEIPELTASAAEAESKEGAEPPSQTVKPPSTIRATPRVRKLAQELGVDLREIRPTGAGGSITEEDVHGHAEHEAGAPSSAAGVERLKLAGIRRAMARHMAESWRSIPHIHQMVEVDARGLADTHRKRGLPYTPFFVRAAALALKRHRWINARLEGEEVLLLREANVAVAIGTEHGLVAPVIHRADQKSVAEIASDLAELTAKAKDQRLTQADTEDGTFTVSNLGMYGIESGTPMINSPQAALLFVGSLRTVPVWTEGGVEEGLRCTLTFAYDHRVIDGVTGAGFSQAVRALLEKAEEL